MEVVYDYIIQNYKAGEPIFASDLYLENVTSDSIRQRLKRLTDVGRLIRYEKGIYYLPKRTRLKSDYAPSADLVARYKYIFRRGEVMGHYAGYTFANQIGISSQVPLKQEIVSNNFAAIVRDVKVGNQVFNVRRSRIHITKENYKILQLLELLKDLDEYTDENYDTVQNQLKQYIVQNEIKREQVDQYLSEYPLKIYKYIYEMRLESVFA